MGSAHGRDSLLGAVVAGRYEVLRLLGRGGMGAVYEVRHLKVKRHFALKTLDTRLVGDTEALARFQREADAVAQLRHPNIVEIVDWETLADGAPAMVIELLAGEDLAARIARKGPLSWSFVARIADQVMSALAVAHRAGIVHRDLKPQNIFLARDDAGQERAKLLDFGVSKMKDSAGIATADEKLLGTPAYMSPEQADGRIADIGPHTDTWAMGAILFEMATARRAFPTGSVMGLLQRICFGEPDVVEAYRADAPAAFCELVARALSRDDARRIRSIAELRGGLRRALEPVAPGAFATEFGDEGTRPDAGLANVPEPAAVAPTIADRPAPPRTATPTPIAVPRGAVSPPAAPADAGAPVDRGGLSTLSRSAVSRPTVPTESVRGRGRWFVLAGVLGGLVATGAVIALSARGLHDRAAARAPSPAASAPASTSTPAPSRESVPVSAPAPAPAPTKAVAVTPTTEPAAAPAVSPEPTAAPVHATSAPPRRPTPRHGAGATPPTPTPTSPAPPPDSAAPPAVATPPAAPTSPTAAPKGPIIFDPFKKKGSP